MIAFILFHTFNGVLRFSSFIDLHRVAYSTFTVHHRAPPLSKTGNNISISTLQILLKVVTFAQASK